MNETRTFDIVVYGATGFTGGLVATYLAEHAPERLRWAIAGRSQTKLEGFRDSLHERTGVSPAILQANAEDVHSLRTMAEQTQVVLSTVGPFIKYGEPLVRVCVEAKSHYVDITGEPEFVDAMIVRYDQAARKAGICIVNCCGFDSIPHDLGVLYTVRQLPHNVPLEVRGFVSSNGSISGGTWNSALEAFARIREGRAMQSARRSAEVRSADRRVRSIAPRIFYEKSLHSWACPLPTIDPQVVRRSARASREYGPDFRYGHYARVRSLPRMVAGTAAIGGLVALAQLPPARQWLQSRKKPGTGPSEARRNKTHFSVTFLARVVGSRPSDHIVTKISGGDPGYTETAKMLAESALCLALDKKELPGTSGVITPAIAMGTPLIERLRRAGMTFQTL